MSARQDDAQFEALYAQYADDVLRMAYFYLADRHKAEDVCQDVFIKLYTQDETIEQREEKEALMRAVNRLPAVFRETVLLHYYQGLGISEIAQMLDLPEGTISSRLSRARKKLEVLLKGEETGE